MKTRANSLVLSTVLVALLGLIAARQTLAQTVTHVSAGSIHSLFSKSDGSLWGMGDNSGGELGLGFVITGTNVPQQILASGAGLVAAGAGQSLIQMGNTLWAMGYNGFGQLGDGTTSPHYFPEQVFSTGSRFVGLGPIAAGGGHSLFATSGAVTSSTSLRGMGENNYGQLGDGTFTNRDTAEVLFSATGSFVTGVAAGYFHSLYLRSNGSLWAMGADDLGELGDGTNSVYTDAQELIVSSGVTAVAAGAQFSLFIKSDGSLWGMGDNTYGQLGDNSTLEHDTPEQLTFNGVKAVAAGYFHSLFIKTDGSLNGMGDNSHGQLGDGTTNQHFFPILIVASNVVAAAAGEQFSFFIKSDGSLWGMGYNQFGQLGTGDYNDRYTPVEIVPPPPPTITSITVSGANVVVNWPTNQGGFTLQSSPDLGPTASWSNVSQGVIVGNQYVVTNSVSGQRMFFRLAE